MYYLIESIPEGRGVISQKKFEHLEDIFDHVHIMLQHYKEYGWEITKDFSNSAGWWQASCKDQHAIVFQYIKVDDNG